jgi:peptidoglycan/LPS O-acetylase OafA/YrhL
MNSPAYRPEIDGLRSIAVLAVILYHSGYSLFAGGFVGVDVFFVISGYLITAIILPEIREGRFRFTRFYERRVRRLFPALFVVLACTTVAALLWTTPGQLKDYGQSLVAVNLFASNVFFFWKTGYFSRLAEEVPLLHTWSLAVEEQFYLVFPLVLMMLLRWAPRWLARWLLVFGLTSLALCVWRSSGAWAALNFFDAIGRAWELLIGAGLAVRHARVPALPAQSRLSSIGAWGGLALVLVSVFGFRPGWSHPGWPTLLPVLGTALLIHFSAAPSAVRALLRARPLVHIGLISYSAYLWHQPLFAFAHLRLEGPWSAWVAPTLILSCLLLAHVSWRWIEGPWREKGRVPAQRVWGLAALGTSALLGFGLAAHLYGGFPARFSPQQVVLSQSMSFSSYRQRCHTEGVNYLKPAEACRLLDDQRVEWSTLGDSHTVELAAALAEQLRTRQAGGVLALSSSGCQPALDFESDLPGCSAWFREALTHLEAKPEIRHVVLLWRHGLYLNGESRSSYPQVPKDPPNFLRGLPDDQARQLYFASLRHVVQRLLAAGKQVYLLDPIPELGVHVERLIFDPAQAAKKLPDRRWYQQRHAELLSQLDALSAGLSDTEHARLHRVRSAAAVCDSDRCAALDRDQALYFDDNHLSMAGAARLADLVLRAVPKEASP